MQQFEWIKLVFNSSAKSFSFFLSGWRKKSFGGSFNASKTHPMFEWLNVRMVECLIGRMFKCLNVQAFECSNVQLFEWFSVGMFGWSNDFFCLFCSTSLRLVLDGFDQLLSIYIYCPRTKQCIAVDKSLRHQE